MSSSTCNLLVIYFMLTLVVVFFLTEAHTAFSEQLGIPMYGRLLEQNLVHESAFEVRLMTSCYLTMRVVSSLCVYGHVMHYVCSFLKRN